MFLACGKGRGGVGGLSESNQKKLVDTEFAMSRLLIFFSSLYIIKSVGKRHQLKSCHSGSRPACQILSSSAAWPSIFITCYNSGIGLDPAVLIQHQMVRGVERKRAIFISWRGFARSVRAVCVLHLSRARISFFFSPS